MFDSRFLGSFEFLEFILTICQTTMDLNKSHYHKPEKSFIWTAPLLWRSTWCWGSEAQLHTVQREFAFGFQIALHGFKMRLVLKYRCTVAAKSTESTEPHLLGTISRPLSGFRPTRFVTHKTSLPLWKSTYVRLGSFQSYWTMHSPTATRQRGKGRKRTLIAGLSHFHSFPIFLGKRGPSGIEIQSTGHRAPSYIQICHHPTDANIQKISNCQ